MSKLLDDAKASLQRRADANGDGKVDMQDVATVIAQVRARASAFAVDEAKKHPTGALIVAAVIAASVGFFFGRL